MPTTRLPKSHRADPPPSASDGKVLPASAAPVNAEAHALFGHSFESVAVSQEDSAPIQRQPEENACYATPPVNPFSIFEGGLGGDAQNASTISFQMANDSQAQQAERGKHMQETQTKIFEVQQDITVNKAKTADKAFNQMDEYIRQ